MKKTIIITIILIIITTIFILLLGESKCSGVGMSIVTNNWGWLGVCK